MWFDKIKRMMDELPEQYLQPKTVDPEIMKLILHDLKPVSQLTEEEKRLTGVGQQLADVIKREVEAYQVLHRNDDSEHSLEAWERFVDRILFIKDELKLVSDTFLISLRERLGIENYYVADGHDIYAILHNEQVASEVPDIFDFDSIPWPKTKH